MKIILHIGRHKTGTTSIQHFLALNEVLLLDRYGIYYPKIGRDPYFKYHHPLFDDWAQGRKNLDLQLINEIIEDAKRKSASSILLSSEALSNDNITETKWIQLKEAFNEEITIIVYLRRQDNYLKAMYAEGIKQGQNISNIKDVKINLDYFQFLEPICRTFTKNRIIVKSFDKAIKQNLYQDFVETLGIAFDDEPQLVVPSKKLNQSLPWRYLNIVRYANNYHPFIRRLIINRINKRLIVSLAKIFPSFFNKPLPLTEAQGQEILSRYEESNKMVARKYIGEEDLF